MKINTFYFCVTSVMMVKNVDDEIVSRFPLEWQGLIKRLWLSLERGITWFTEETSSKYGGHLFWYKLIKALIKCEPFIEGDKLGFKPRFLLLPEVVQERLVEFLQQQAYLIPDLEIRQLILGLIKHTDPQSDLYQQLQHLVRKTKLQENFFTEAAEVLNSEILDHSQKKHKERKDDRKETTDSQECVIILDASDDETKEPAPKRQRTDRDSSVPHAEQNSQIVSMETGKADDKNNDVSPDTIFDGKEGLICKTKEIWQNCIKDKEIEGLSEISKLSLKEIEVFCRMIDFDSMSDDSIELVCQHLCQVADSLSYSSAICILTFVLGHRITKLSHNASRKLLGAITLVSQNFPKQTVESVLVPCVLQLEVSSAQTEILCKTLKDSMNASTRGFFIQKVLQKDLVLNENKIPILQTVIDSGCDLTCDVMSSLLHCLNEESVSMAKNLKFGKLVFAIVNKQSKLFNQELKTKVEHILDKHSTFLKKSIHTSLNKIKLV